jgi:hypothetical protein
VTTYVAHEELGSLEISGVDGMGMLYKADHEMHGCVLTVDAISQPRSGENLEALGPGRNNHPSPPPSVRFLSEDIGKEATNLMQDGFSIKRLGLGAADLLSERELVMGSADAIVPNFQAASLPSTLVRDSTPREWRNGRRAGFRIRCPKGRGGSTPPSRTT